MKRVPILLILTLFVFCTFVTPSLSETRDIVSREASSNQPIRHPPLEWSLRAGESLKDLAKLIYPHQHRMQVQFIHAAQQLNPDLFSVHLPGHVFESETSILIPDLRQVAVVPKGEKSPALHRRNHPVQHVPPTELLVQPTVAMVPSDELQALTSRNEALQRQEKVLAEKMNALEKNLRQLKEALQHQPERLPPVPALKEMPKTQSAVASKPLSIANKPLQIDFSLFAQLKPVTQGWFNLSFVIMLVSGGIALTAIFGMWLRQKKYKKRAEAPEFVAKPTQDHTVLPSLIFDNPLPSIPSPPISSALSVDEIASVVEEARIFVGMGRDDHAIHVLVDYIAQYPLASAEPWIYLLEIYRMKHRQEDFIKTADQFHKAFNVEAPSWESTKPTNATISLEDYPQIISRITAVWPTQAAMEIIDELLLDNRSGERQGFHLEILQELLLLKYLLETRDDFAMLKPF